LLAPPTTAAAAAAADAGGGAADDAALPAMKKTAAVISIVPSHRASTAGRGASGEDASAMACGKSGRRREGQPLHQG
jgi:hypothetical protein